MKRKSRVINGSAMKTKSLHFQWTLFLFLFLLILLIAAVIPLPRQDVVLGLNTNLIVPLPYSVQLIHPTLLRVGEYGKILLSLKPQIESGNGKPTLEKLLIETRLDMPGARVSPPSGTSQPLIQGKGLDFKWQVLPGMAGKLSGTLWISAYREDNTGGEMERIPFLAYPFEITVISLLGMTAPLVKWIAGIGLMVCFVYLVAIVWK
jgi:hypothetical protein